MAPQLEAPPLVEPRQLAPVPHLVVIAVQHGHVFRDDFTRSLKRRLEEARTPHGRVEPLPQWQRIEVDGLLYCPAATQGETAHPRPLEGLAREGRPDAPLDEDEAASSYPALHLQPRAG